MGDWYNGQYRVVQGIDELGRTQLGRGDIIVHKSGMLILRCPACNAMQFGQASVLNSPDAPTLSKPLQCGSGHCKRCGVWFSIRNGKASEAESPVNAQTEIPDRLKKAGVGPARVESSPQVKPKPRLKDLNR